MNLAISQALMYHQHTLNLRLINLPCHKPRLLHLPVAHLLMSQGQVNASAMPQDFISAYVTSPARSQWVTHADMQGDYTETVMKTNLTDAQMFWETEMEKTVPTKWGRWSPKTKVESGSLWGGNNPGWSQGLRILPVTNRKQQGRNGWRSHVCWNHAAEQCVCVCVRGVEWQIKLSSRWE